MKLSIIIPIYNAGPYIRNCVDSIINQQCECDIELLLIDNGSTDISLEICKEYEKKISWIKLFIEHTKGPSAARNKGLNNATGDYVWFVDADDSITSGAIACIENALAKNKLCEILCFNYQRIYSDRVNVVMNFQESSIICPAIDVTMSKTTFYSWNKVYMRNVIGETRFIEDVSNTEDFFFSFTIVRKVKMLYTIPDVLYNHNCTNPNSIQNSKSLRQIIKNRNDTFRIDELFYRDYKNSTDAHEQSVMNEIISVGLASTLYAAFLTSNVRSTLKTIEFYKKLGTYPIKYSTNRKANFFIAFANQKWLFVNVLRCAIMVKKCLR